jgi:hypothetical protein
LGSVLYFVVRGLSATLGGVLALCVGIRDSAFAAQALPLCGAALTFFAAAKKVSKESGLTPPILGRYPRAPDVPTLLAAAYSLMFVANVLPHRLTRFT